MSLLPLTAPPLSDSRAEYGAVVAIFVANPKQCAYIYRDDEHSADQLLRYYQEAAVDA